MSELDRILKLAGSQATVEETPSPAPEATQREMKPVAQEAVGEFADPILDLIDELGSHSIVLDELIRYLDGDTIKDFVSDFRRHNDMNHPGEDGDDDKNFESVTEAEGHKVINHNKPVDLAGNSIWQGEKRGEPVTTSV